MARTWTKPLVLRADDVEPFSYDGSSRYLSQQVVGSENGGPHDILTIWPQPQRTGANKLHEKRRQTWGTGFKLRQGRELIKPAS